MIQELLIWMLFGSATVFVARKIFLEFTAKNGCPKGCGTCEVSQPETIQMNSSIKSII